MMFEQHFLLLQLLVSMERLRMSGKASTKELSLFINNFDKQGIDEMSLMDSKPTWMAGQVWYSTIIGIFYVFFCDFQHNIMIICLLCKRHIMECSCMFIWSTLYDNFLMLWVCFFGPHYMITFWCYGYVFWSTLYDNFLMGIFYHCIMYLIPCPPILKCNCL